MSDLSDSSLNLQSTQELLEAFPGEYPHGMLDSVAQGVVTEVEDSLPGDIRSQLHNLSDFKITFALSDVASLLKYVIDEVQMLKVHSAKEYVYLQQQAKRDSELNVNTAVGLDSLKELANVQRQKIIQQEQRLDGQEQSISGLRDALKEQTKIADEGRELVEHLSAQCDELRSQCMYSDGGQNRTSILMPMQSIDGGVGNSLLFDSFNNGPNMINAQQSSNSTESNVLQAGTGENILNSATGGTATSKPPLQQQEGIPPGLKAVAEAVKVLAKQQQAFNRFICGHQGVQNQHAADFSSLRPTSCASVRSTAYSTNSGLMLTRHPSSCSNRGDGPCHAPGCCQADFVVRALTLAPPLLGVDQKEAEQIRNSLLQKHEQQQNYQQQQLQQEHGYQPSPRLHHLTVSMDTASRGSKPGRPSSSAVVDSRERSHSNYSQEENLDEKKFIGLDEFERCKGEITDKLAQYDDQMAKIALLSEQIDAAVFSQQQLEEKLLHIKALQEGEFGNTEDMVMDSNAVRRSIVSLHAKLRQVNDKVDTVSNLAVSTRQLLSKPPEEDKHALKALSLRTYECEMGLQEVHDKVIMLAHFCKQLKGSNITGSNNSSSISGFNEGNTAAELDVALISRAAAIDTILDHKLQRRNPGVMNTQLAHALRDLEQLEGLQDKLDGARDVLQRLDDMGQLGRKVQTLLDCDLLERITYLERRVNTELSFVKSHLSGKVDQTNFRAVLSLLQSTGGVGSSGSTAVKKLPPGVSGVNGTTGSVILSHADLITAISGKADVTMLRKLEELVRALDRQTREALVKVMKELVALQSNNNSNRNSDNVGLLKHGSRNSSRSVAPNVLSPSADQSGMNVQHTLQQIDELRTQVVKLKGTVAMQETLLQDKASIDVVESLRARLLEYNPNEPHDAVGPSQSFNDEKLVRLHQQSDSATSKLQQHQEWIARNALDIRDLREWVRFAQGVLEQQGTHGDSIRLLDRKLDKLQKTNPPNSLPPVTRMRTASRDVAAGTYRPLPVDRCIVCDKDTTTTQRLPEHAPAPLRRYVTSRVPAGGLNGSHSVLQLPNTTITNK